MQLTYHIILHIHAKYYVRFPLRCVRVYHTIFVFGLVYMLTLYSHCLRARAQLAMFLCNRGARRCVVCCIYYYICARRRVCNKCVQVQFCNFAPCATHARSLGSAHVERGRAVSERALVVVYLSPRAVVWQ